MKFFIQSFALAAFVLATSFMSCVHAGKTGEHKESSERHEEHRGGHEGREKGEHRQESRERGEHGGSHESREKGEHSKGGESEEAGMEYTLTDTFDKTKYGARLVLAYDAKENAFKGTVQNMTNETLERVRVEVHLSNGKELGPTTPESLKPGAKRTVFLKAGEQDFTAWSTHAEVGNMEHGVHGEGHEEGGEGRGEHGGEGSGHEEGEGHEQGGDGRSSITIPIAEGFKGIIDEFEVDMSFDPETRSVVGTVKNISSKKMCYVQTEHHLKKGKRTVGEMKTTRIGDLKPGEKKSTTSPIREKDRSRLTNGTFDGYVIHIEVSDCEGSGPKSHEGRERGERHGEGHKEGKGEHGGGK